MHNLRLMGYLFVICIVSMIQAENTAEIRENFANVAQNSKDLAYSVGSLLHSVGNEVVNQTKKLGNVIATYVDSLQQPDNSGLIQVKIEEKEEHIAVVIEGLTDVNTTTCENAELIFMESFPVRIRATIQINSNTILTLSSTEGRENLVVNLIATSKETVEENKDEVMLKASELKQQKITKQVTAALPIDLEKLTIDLDIAVGQMIITIPYSTKTIKSVPVNIK